MPLPAVLENSVGPLEPAEEPAEADPGEDERRRRWPLGLPPGADAEEELPLEAAIVCHIFVLNSVLERTGNRVAEAHHLTLPQWMALGCIGRGGAEGLTHSELGQRLALSKAPITGVVDRLERAGYVTRTTSQSDRRVSRIRATEAGLRVWREVRDIMRAQAAEHCAPLGVEGREDLLDLLSRLLEQVAASDPTLSVMRTARPSTQVLEGDASGKY